jgi:hypothetical protein
VLLVPDPPVLRKPGRAGNRNRSSGSVARNSDYQTTEVVLQLLHLAKIVANGAVAIQVAPGCTDVPKTTTSHKLNVNNRKVPGLAIHR